MDTPDSLGHDYLPASSTPSLARTVQQIDASVVEEPVLKLVVTGTGPTATLLDGTVTRPLNALGP